MNETLITNDILDSVKLLLGITRDYTHFDPMIVMHINSVFTVLNQLGVGPSEGFSITYGVPQDEREQWTDFLPDGEQLELVKSYMYLKVRLLFDPPQSSTVLDAMNRMISEFEWRLNVAVDS